MKRLPSLSALSWFYAVSFILIVTGSVSRSYALGVCVLVGLWMFLRPLEDGLLFFTRTIPFFIALPLTASYDNLNMWRILSLVLFFRFLIEPSSFVALRATFSEVLHQPKRWLKNHPVASQILLLLALAIISLLAAPHPLVGVKRIIYFINLSMVPVVLWALLRQGRVRTPDVIRNLAIPTILVVSIGFLQLASTYLMDVYQFMRVWGEHIQLNQFGTQWSYIAVHVGNTWLAYYGSQLSLRVFSVFPDSHSFPTFILLGIPALLATASGPILRIIAATPWKRLIRTYAALSIVWVPLAFLAAILSGTRGIWAASLGVIILIPLWLVIMRRSGVSEVGRRVFAYGASYIALFFMLFLVAWPIFISPQFLLGKGDLSMFSRRISSVIDFGETSNALRIAIWKASVTSIGQHPFIGVGIGNFPVVLNQRVELARAGSTAHNLYLHVAAEMGILAALAVIALLAQSLSSAYRWFRSAEGSEQMFAGSLLLYLPWVYAYVLTDPILFDERVFLFFASILALIWSHDYGAT